MTNPIYAISNDGKILRLVTDGDLQEKIFGEFKKQENIFSNKTNPIDYVENKSITSLLPDDSYFFIKDFPDTLGMVKAINSGISHSEEVQSIDTIKAIFTGYIDKSSNKYYFLIQEFNQRTSGSLKKFRFGFAKNTFIPISSSVLSLDLKLTAIFVCDTNKIGLGELRFVTFAGVCRIFDMEEYKHNASDKDVQDFLRHPLLDFTEFQTQQQNLFTGDDGFEKFIKNHRAKKIGFIMQSKILNDITIEDLYEGIKEVGIDAKIENNKIVVPSEIPEFETFLKCLSEEVYNGRFTKETFEALSRKKYKK